MHVRIFLPPKSTMQSGRANLKVWRLEGVPESARLPESLMGWPLSKDTDPQVKMRFSSKEAAIEHADAQGWTYDVEQPNARKVTPRSYQNRFDVKEESEL